MFKFDGCKDFQAQLIDEKIPATLPINEILSAATRGYRDVEDYHWMLGNMIETFRALGYRWVDGIEVYQLIEQSYSTESRITLDQVADLWDAKNK